jgi:hypothetical protein
MNKRDRLFWGSVGVISILSIYLVATFFVSAEYDTSGFTEYNVEGRFSIMIPPYLVQDDSLSTKATVSFSDFSNEVYLMVIDEKKRELRRKDIRPSLMEYFDFVYSDLEQRLSAISLENLIQTERHNLPLVTAELNAQYEDHDIYYILTTYEHPRSFFQLRGWTTLEAKPYIKRDLFATMHSLRVED